MKKTNSKVPTTSYRNDVLKFAAEKYHTEPEYPWLTAPDYVVLRHADNRKWYGLIMNVPRERLGLSGDDVIDILDIKCDPLVSGSLRMENGYLPAYHMHHESWLTVLLDGTVKKEEIFSLLELSFELTASHTRKKKSKSYFRREWLVPANPKYFDLEKAFSESDSILWKQSSNVSVGDMVYLYVAAPVSAICYRCEAMEVDIPYNYDDGKVHMNHVMRLKLLQRYSPTVFTFEKLKEYGIFSIRGPRYMPNSLLHEIGKVNQAQ